jgi:hypothetical protein
VVPAGTILPPPFAGVTVNAVPLQIVAVRLVTKGVGFTVILAVALAAEAHPLAEAVIVNTVVCGVFVVFTKVPVMGVPVPGDAMPVILAVFVLNQL